MIREQHIEGSQASTMGAMASHPWKKWEGTANRKLPIFIALILIILTGVLLATVRDSEAIPAWARKYGVDCSLCHYPAVPRLSSFGQKFRWAGYRMPDEFGKEQDVTRVGDFFSTRVRARFEYENPEEKIERTEFTLHDATLFYAGAFTKNYSGFV